MASDPVTLRLIERLAEAVAELAAAVEETYPGTYGAPWRSHAEADKIAKEAGAAAQELEG